MKLGELGSIQDYTVYCTSEELETPEGYKEPIFIVKYDEMMTPSFFGVGPDGEILETSDPLKKENKFHSECRICGSDIDHLNKMYWVQAQMVSYNTLFEEKEWTPLNNSCIPICPECERIIYEFTQKVLDQHSDVLVRSKL